MYMSGIERGVSAAVLYSIVCEISAHQPWRLGEDFELHNSGVATNDKSMV